MNPDTSGLLVGRNPVWPPDRLRLRLRMTQDEGLFGQALNSAAKKHIASPNSWSCGAERAEKFIPQLRDWT